MEAFINGKRDRESLMLNRKSFTPSVSVVCFLFWLVVCCALFTVRSSIAQTGTGSISGNVEVYLYNTPLAGITVQAYDYTWHFIQSAVTDVDGHYSITGLPASAYYLRTLNDLGYVDKYYYMASSGLPIRSYASIVMVNAGADTGYKDFTLETGAHSISGRVVRDGSGEGLEGITVFAGYQSTSDSSIVAAVVTDNSGNYVIPGLKPGTYYVYTYNTMGYADEVYDNGILYFVPDIDPVNLPYHDITGIDFSLAVGGSVSGRVVRDSDGAGLSDSNVFIFTDMLAGRFYITKTDSEGYYSLDGIAPGDYHVGASHSGYIPNYYDDADYLGSTVVTVPPSESVTDIDISLETEGTISGNIKRAFDQSVVNLGLTIDVYDRDGIPVSSTTLSSQGSYQVKGLKSGLYYMHIKGGKYSSSSGYRQSGLASQYYAGAATLAESTPVRVLQGQDTGGIDFNLDRDSAITGKVTREQGGAALRYAIVQVYDNKWRMVDYAATDSSGNYSISGLPPCDYYIGTRGFHSDAYRLGTPDDNYIDLFHGGSGTRDEATVISLGYDENVANINFVLPAGDSITGSVIDSTGQAGIPDASLIVYDEDWKQIKVVTTDESGNYSVNGLAPGDYYVRTDASPGFVDVYYNVASTADDATAVTVIQRQDTADINFELDSSFGIYGTVTSLFYGDAIEGVRIDAFNSNWEFIASGTTDFLGRYRIENLEYGKYYLKTYNPKGYLDEYCCHSTIENEAVPVFLQNVSINADFVLAKKYHNDFNGDGNTDLVWRNEATGKNAVWFMDGVVKTGSASLSTVSDVTWKIVGTADFNGDGDTDILWRNDVSGKNTLWFMDGVTKTGSVSLSKVPDVTWKIVGLGDFNADGDTDIVWRNETTGKNNVWFMDGAVKTGSAVLSAVPDTNWKIVGTADFNGDGDTDLVWRNAATGKNAVWIMDGVVKTGSTSLPSVSDTNWKIVVTVDFNGDADADLVWRNTVTGKNAVWYMNGMTVAGSASLPSVSDISWVIAPQRY
jgi:hypothetical protein